MKTLAVVACAVLAGCATTTTPIATTGGRAVPAERIVDNGYLTDRPGTGIVVIKRDAVMQLGSLCLMRVYVNGQPIADLKASEKVALYLPPGDYIFGVQPIGSLCGGTVQEAEGIVTVARPLAYRIGATQFGGNFFTVTMF